jgi:hypothetical protein
MAAEEVAAAMVATVRPNGSSGGGPDAVRTNARGAPDMMPDPKVVG